jgi:hypothetical protein
MLRIPEITLPVNVVKFVLFASTYKPTHPVAPSAFAAVH